MPSRKIPPKGLERHTRSSQKMVEPGATSSQKNSEFKEKTKGIQIRFSKRILGKKTAKENLMKTSKVPQKSVSLKNKTYKKLDMPSIKASESVKKSKTSAKLVRTPKASGKLVKTRKSSGKLVKTTKSSGKLVRTPKSSEKLVRTPKSSVKLAKTPKSSVKLVRTSKPVGKRNIPSGKVIRNLKINTKIVSPSQSLETNGKIVALTSPKNLKQASRIVPMQPTFCFICKRNFISNKRLNCHNAKHHFFRHCPNCPKTFQKTRKFIFHLRSHINDHPYECNICLASFNRKRDLRQHKIAHRDLKRLECEICSEVFPHLASLNRHRLTHSGPPYPCDECGALFTNVPDSTVHSKNHVQRCLLCPKEVVAFPSNVDLASHMYEVHRSKEYHPANSDAICTFQDCVSTGAVNLEEDSGSDCMEDLLSSSDCESDSDTDDCYQKEAVEPVYTLRRKDKFICFICYDLYPSDELLKTHMQGHKWHPCNTCSQFFADADTLEKHDCDFAKAPSICKACNGKVKCDKCKLNSEQSIATTFPGMPEFLIMRYYEPAHCNWLFSFIKHVKSGKQPLDIRTLNYIGSHNTTLELILKNSNVRGMFPNDCISYIKNLFSEFQDLSRMLCDRINHI